MRKILALGAGLMLVATAFAPADLTAQSTGNAAPVPGPYMAPIMARNMVVPAPVVSVNPYSNQGFAQPMPYWMKPAQRPGGAAPANAGNTGPGPTAQRRNNFIPGWVWRPYAPTAARTNSGRRPTAPGPTAARPTVPAYPQRFEQGYMPRPQYFPGYGQQPWPGYGNTPWGANQPRGYGAVRQPQQ